MKLTTHGLNSSIDWIISNEEPLLYHNPQKLRKKARAAVVHASACFLLLPDSFNVRIIYIRLDVQLLG